MQQGLSAGPEKLVYKIFLRWLSDEIIPAYAQQVMKSFENG
jgi:hypothetical protein